MPTIRFTLSYILLLHLLMRPAYIIVPENKQGLHLLNLMNVYTSLQSKRQYLLGKYSDNLIIKGTPWDKTFSILLILTI